jgi:tetratricopeptide (TPR) repeat protein
MKKLLLALLFISGSVFAEATFDQIEGLIQQRNYAAAEAGLEVIIKNHPQSAKAFYAMAQAQAGLGNQEKALKALNIATGLNPTLDFAPASSVASLKQAITPQVSKIEAIEETHTVRNTILVMFVLALCFVGYTVYRRNKEADEAYQATLDAEEKARADREAERKRQHMEMLAKMDADRKAELAAEAAKEAALKAHKNYGHERFDPENPDKLKTVKQFKEEKVAEEMLAQARREAADARVRADAAEASARMYRSSAQTVQPTHTTVVNNSSNDMLTGVLIGNMLSGSHHDTTRVVEREVVREVPTPSRSSTWDDTPSTPSRSSSWDDDSSSKPSSSWSSSSSSDSSSSWSSSSSSDSSSSSSWD